MSLLFSATLLAGALLTFWLILRKIRKAEVTIADSTFWFRESGELCLRLCDCGSRHP